MLIISLTLITAGCNVPVSRNQEFDTALAKFTPVNTLYGPMGGQNISATFLQEVGCRTINGQQECPSGSQVPVSGVTSTSGNTAWTATYDDWPTNYVQSGMYMPADWTVNFTPNQTCLDPKTPATSAAPYPLLPATQTMIQELDPGVGSESWSIGFGDGVIFTTTTTLASPQPVQFTCYVNTLANPQISPTGVLPRFVLDDLLPPYVQVAAISRIAASPLYTTLRLFSSDLQEFSATTATSVAPDGMSATFPYPTQPNKFELPAGGYIGTITTDIPGQQETTNALEPFLIGHDSQTYPGAFGAAYVAPSMVVTATTPIYTRGLCLPGARVVTTSGFSGAAVTSVTQNRLILPNGTSIAVGSSPTVAIALNYTSSLVVNDDDPCTLTTTRYNGAQSILVVNTGSNSVQIVTIGQQPSLSQGTIGVGRKPVAAALAPNGLVYVANYLDGTVSEVNTTTMLQTRTIAVMPNPTSVSFDATGNLWVGGQGYVDEVSIPNWAITSTIAVDGTVNQMAYSPRENAMIQILLQNGTVSSPSNGKTMTSNISYASANSSYSAVNVMNAASKTSSGPTIAAVSTATYIQSPISQYLAFPAQTAFVPPILSTSGLTMPPLTSTAGEVVAVVNGNSFTLTYLPSGDQLVSGTLPYPIRGVAVGPSAVYFTMPESNSVVTVPIKF
jgi:hypothetical protein